MKTSQHAKRAPLRSGLGLNLLVLFGGILFSGLLSVISGQCLNYDLFNYHYYNAYSFVNGRLYFDYGVANIHGYFNPLLDLPLYILSTQLKPIWVGLFLGGGHGLVIWLVFAIAYSFLGDLPHRSRVLLSLLCALVSFCGPFNLSELGACINDNVIGIFVCLSVLLVVREFPLKGGGALPKFRKSILVAGLVIGVGSGLKLTGFIYALSGWLALLVISMGWKEKVQSLLLWGAGVVGGFLISAGYWMWILWDRFRNPIFPMYNKLFKSPYYYLTNFHDNRFFPKELAGWLFQPFYHLKSDDSVIYSDLRLALVYVLVFVVSVIFFLRNSVSRKSREMHTSVPFHDGHRYVLAFIILSYIVWLRMFSVYRYMIPTETLAPVSITILFSWLLSNRALRVFVICFFFLVIVAWQKVPDWGRTAWPDQYFTVHVPAIPNHDTAMIIMPFSPHEIPSYMVPSFPPEIRFIRLKSWLTKPDDKSKMQDELKDIIQRHNGSIYMMTREPVEDNRLLSTYYGLGMTPGRPLPVDGPTGRFGLYSLERL